LASSLFRPRRNILAVFDGVFYWFAQVVAAGLLRPNLHSAISELWLLVLASKLFGR